MMQIVRDCSRLAVISACLTFAQLLTACGTEQIVGSTVGATVLGAQSPNNEIQQIYYLGVFDPQEQLPPQVYRVRVHGQASFISATRFASGWVHADLIDSLGSSVGFDDEGTLKIEKGDGDEFKTFKTGRRLMLFGPEGFREAPRNHRLVIVMGSNPEGFFNAVDSALGSFSEVRLQQENSALDRELFEALLRIRNQREGLDQLLRDVERELKETPVQTSSSTHGALHLLDGDRSPEQYARRAKIAEERTVKDSDAVAGISATAAPTAAVELGSSK